MERTSVILHLVGLAPGDGDPLEAYRTVRRELEEYADDLARKQSLVVLNKVDLLSPEDREKLRQGFEEETGISPLLVSAVAGDGISSLVGALVEMVEKVRESAHG